MVSARMAQVRGLGFCLQVLFGFFLAASPGAPNALKGSRDAGGTSGAFIGSPVALRPGRRGGRAGSDGRIAAELGE